MKSFNSLLILSILILSSCSSNEELLIEEPTSELLTPYTIKRDGSGAYSLGYTTATNVKVENIKNLSTNSLQLYLVESKNTQSSQVNEPLAIENGQLSVNFFDTKTNKQPKITILDNDIYQARSTKSNELLSTYSITNNTDGTYSLDFTVKNNVAVDFMYDDDKNIYEIHLQKDDTGLQSEFAKNFTKEDGIALNIQFVNHMKNTNARTFNPLGRKPIIIIEE